MPTVRALMGQLRAHEITVDDLVDQFRRCPPVVRAPAQSLGEAYERAEEMPSDNETFWIDAAYHQHVIDDTEYDRLFDAISAGRDLRAMTELWKIAEGWTIVFTSVAESIGPRSSDAPPGANSTGPRHFNNRQTLYLPEKVA